MSECSTNSTQANFERTQKPSTEPGKSEKMCVTLLLEWKLLYSTRARVVLHVGVFTPDQRNASDENLENTHVHCTIIKKD